MDSKTISNVLSKVCMFSCRALRVLVVFVAVMFIMPFAIAYFVWKDEIEE